MYRQTTRLRTTTLPAALGAGFLILSLAACGGSGDGGPPSGPAGTSATAATTGATPAAPAPSASASATPGAPAGESDGASDSQSETATGGLEAALTSVLGDGTQIVTGAQLKELQQNSQGITDAVTVTPAECGPEGKAAATGELPEGTEMTGGVVVETTETGAASDMLSVALYPDAAAASEAIAGLEEYALACPSYSMEMSESLTAEATMDVEDVEVAGDAVLGITIDTTVSVEGASLPAGAGNGTSTTVYVQDGERLVTYAGTTAGGAPKTVDDGVELIDALRAELDG